MARVGYIGTFCSVVLFAVSLSSASATQAATVSSSTDNGWGHVYVGGPMDYSPAFDLKVFAAEPAEHRSASLRHPPEGPRSMPVHERVSKAAVRPTAIAGWRSGRVKRLAAA